MKNTKFIVGLFLIFSASVNAAEIPVELQGGWSPVKQCPKKFKWNEVQDAFEITKDGMSSFEGECTANKLENKGNKINVEWSCKLGTNKDISKKAYEIKGNQMTEEFSGMKSKYYRCK